MNYVQQLWPMSACATRRPVELRSQREYFKELSRIYGRSLKSYEYRMQNISHVYSLQGRQWISGLKPARYVGAKIIKNIERIMSEV